MQVTINGSLANFPDPISLNTLVTAGASITLDNGGMPYATSYKQISCGLRLANPLKCTLAATFYPTTATNSADYGIAYPAIITSSGTAISLGNGFVSCVTGRYALKFYNQDIVDGTINKLSRAEIN